MNVLGLCSGAGGLELGIRLAVPAARGVCYVEREAFAAAALVGHMEAGTLDQAPVWSDLATFDGRPWRGRVHCVASGDPCQPNSVAGKRLGEEDDRFLADQVIRVVDEVRPLCVFRENVPGNADGQLRVLVPALEGLGYRVECGLFSSAETGNSHGRKRLILLAYLSDIKGRLYTRQWRPGEGAAIAGGVGGDMGNAAHDQRRGELEAQGTRSGRSGPAGTGAGVGDAAGERQREGRSQYAREQGRRAAAGPGGQLADAGAARLQGRELCRPCDTEQHGIDAPGPAAELRGACLPPEPILVPGPGDARWTELLQSRPELVPAYSPYDRFEAAIRDAGFTPDGRPLTRAWQKMAARMDADALRAVRAAIFQKTAQSHLRRGADALAHRVERLRLLGNGVDPVVAAYAWLCLDARHREREARERPARADDAAVRAA